MPPIDFSDTLTSSTRAVAALCRALVTMSVVALFTPAHAWEHENSKVKFVEYREGLIEQLKNDKKPYFLLFSAEWCFWCHEFSEKTLTDDRVADYLNANYSNVFIDADINSAAYLKYKATGVPFTVFLNPDASPHFRYAGTLFADDFLTVIKDVRSNVARGVSVERNDASELAYEPPKTLALAEIKEAGNEFRRSVLGNFDAEEHGLGKGEKAIYPRTFLYLLKGADEQRNQAITPVRRSLERAIEKIYDPVEGGFFRYAETRDWKIPHYEKMADLNAGTVLLLYRLNALSPSPSLVSAADQTLGYLRSTLYSPKVGVFLSFQQADEHYYFIMSREDRKKAKTPAVIEKIFIDRLASTVDYLLDVLEFRPDQELRQQVISSLDFVANSFEEKGTLSRYYTVSKGEWSGEGTLQDYALVSRMFLNASYRLHAPRYGFLAKRVIDQAIGQFHDKTTGVLTDPSLGDTNDAEFLMEVNALFAENLMALQGNGSYEALIASIVTYFSATGEIFEERVWEGKDWEFTERYVPYLRLVDSYQSKSKVAVQQQ